MLEFRLIKSYELRKQTGSTTLQLASQGKQILPTIQHVLSWALSPKERAQTEEPHRMTCKMFSSETYGEVRLKALIGLVYSRSNLGVPPAISHLKDSFREGRRRHCIEAHSESQEFTGLHNGQLGWTQWKSISPLALRGLRALAVLGPLGLDHEQSEMTSCLVLLLTEIAFLYSDLCWLSVLV